ncbi:MAG: Sapep family Mn(2+)-dependent dipeptidase [Candidatus Sumerlaeota bacterium]|nr:Sapep family Mn(2+)-dependent dipeptidase [Candidatus Sumerlaeota bacterium]
MPALSKEFQKRLFGQVEELKGNLIKDTAKIITYETVSGGKTDEEREKFNREIGRLLDYLKNLASRLGLVYRDLDGIVSVIEQPGTGDEKGLGIPLHIDVVPATGEWKYPPFSGTVADGIIWGRGAQDDKGPFMACLYALVALKKMGLSFHRPVHIIMGRGEEVGEWSDVQYFIKKESAPAFSFTPDAAFPVINGEKGIMNLKINSEWEPEEGGGDLQFLSLSAGVRTNVVPDLATVTFAAKDKERAMAELARELSTFAANNKEVRFSGPEVCESRPPEADCLKVTFHGKSAHGSLPQEGHNAILDALLFLSNHTSVPQPCRAYMDFLYRVCSPLFGEGLDIAIEHHFVGKTTVNLGICNINKKEGRAQVNIRPTLGLACKEVARRAIALLKKESAKTGVRMYVEESKDWGREALFVDPEENAFFISSLQEAYQCVTGREPKLQAIGGTTFAKAYPNCVSYGPVDYTEEKELAHMTDEHVVIAHHVRNAKIYAAAMALLVMDIRQ